MSHLVSQPHPMPVIGHPEIYYVKHIKQAEDAGAFHAREAYKVGRYITLALDPNCSWDEKYRYFRHLLKHHTTAPPGSDAETQAYYEKLLDMVRRYASQEAMRCLKKEHDKLRARRQAGEPLDKLRMEAGALFGSIVGQEISCPSWMRSDTWQQIKQLQNQWG